MQRSFAVISTVSKEQQRRCYAIVGEAPGYRGCALTGIPFTDKVQLKHLENYVLRDWAHSEQYWQHGRTPSLCGMAGTAGISHHPAPMECVSFPSLSRGEEGIPPDSDTKRTEKGTVVSGGIEVHLHDRRFPGTCPREKGEKDAGVAQ